MGSAMSCDSAHLHCTPAHCKPHLACTQVAGTLLTLHPSQVCTFYLKGECRYGDSCRYLHTKPEWGQKARPSGASSSGYVAPAVPRPAADDLAVQLPISRLRLGGQAPDAAPAQPQLPLPVPLPLPVQLPPDPFGSELSCGAGGSGAAPGGAEPGSGTYEEEGGGWDEQGYAAEQQRRQQTAWHGGGEGGGGEEEGYWEEGYGHAYEEGGYEEGHWPEGQQEGAWAEGEEWGGQYGEEAYAEAYGGGGGDPAEQHAGLQPAAGAWSLPEGGAGEQQEWGAGAPASLRSLCMLWFKAGACPKGSRCQLVHGEQCPHCGKHALHPADADQRQQHLAECRLRHERLAARARRCGRQGVGVPACRPGSNCPYLLLLWPSSHKPTARSVLTHTASPPHPLPAPTTLLQRGGGVRHLPGAGAEQGGAWGAQVWAAHRLRPPVLPALHPQLARQDRHTR